MPIIHVYDKGGTLLSSHTFAPEVLSVTIGRGTANNVVVADPTVSKRHASISFIGTTFYLRDEGSSNGTSIEGRRIREAELREGERVRIGSCTFVLSLDRSAPPPKLAPSRSSAPTAAHRATASRPTTSIPTPAVPERQPGGDSPDPPPGAAQPHPERRGGRLRRLGVFLVVVAVGATVATVVRRQHASDIPPPGSMGRGLASDLFSSPVPGAMVNVWSGNLVLLATDLVVPRGAGEIRLERTFDSRSSLAGAFGPGWSSSLDRPSAFEAAGLVVERDSLGRIVALDDSTGQRLTVIWKGARPATVGGPAGYRVAYGYDQLGQLSEARLTAGRTTAYEYDSARRLIRIIRPDGTRVEVRYHRRSPSVAAVIGPGSAVTRFTYTVDGSDIRTVVTDAAGARTVFERHPERREMLLTDPMGRTTRYELDDNGSGVKPILDPSGASASQPAGATTAGTVGAPPPGAVGSAVIGLPGRTAVPAVVGLAADTARAVVLESRLVPVVTLHDSPPERRELAFKVFFQSPDADTSVAENSVVTVKAWPAFPTSDPATVQVPRVIGLARGEAIATLEAAGLIPDPVAGSFAPSRDARDIVYWQSMVGGLQSPKGTTVGVRYYLSGNIEVPNVTGMFWRNAKQALEKGGLRAEPMVGDKAPPSPRHIDHVESQYPVGGSFVPPESEVTISTWFSEGFQPWDGADVDPRFAEGTVTDGAIEAERSFDADYPGTGARTAIEATVGEIGVKGQPRVPEGATWWVKRYRSGDDAERFIHQLVTLWSKTSETFGEGVRSRIVSFDTGTNWVVFHAEAVVDSHPELGIEGFAASVYYRAAVYRREFIIAYGARQPSLGYDGFPRQWQDVELGSKVLVDWRFPSSSSPRR